jgi:hypothetical protein
MVQVLPAATDSSHPDTSNAGGDDSVIFVNEIVRLFVRVSVAVSLFSPWSVCGNVSDAGDTKIGSAPSRVPAGPDFIFWKAAT